MVRTSIINKLIHDGLVGEFQRDHLTQISDEMFEEFVANFNPHHDKGGRFASGSGGGGGMMSADTGGGFGGGGTPIPPTKGFTHPVGSKVEISGVRDAVIVGQTMPARGKKKAMYQIEYTVDDELERANPTGRRYQQPRFDGEFKVVDIPTTMEAAEANVRGFRSDKNRG